MATTSAAVKASEAQAQFYKELAEKTRLERARLERDEARYFASQDAHRLFTFDMQVSKNSVAECIAFLGQWHREDPTKPVKLIFNSPGGSVIDGLALFDYVIQLRNEGAKIDTVTLGYAASMAGILLQCGEKRSMGKNAYLMIHEVSSGAIGKISEIEDEAKFVKQLNDRLFAILADRSSLSLRSILRRAKRKDWWLDAEQALEHGFCDEID